MPSSLHRSTLLIMNFGVAFILGPVLFELPHEPTTWIGLGAVYIVCGIVGWKRRRDGVQTPFTVRTALFVAASAVSIPLMLRVWSLLSAQPGLTLGEIAWVFTEFQVLVPLFAASMLVLGVASGRWKILFVVILFVTYVWWTVSGIEAGVGFGPFFVVLFNAAIFLVGIVIGLPLYFYGRWLARTGDSDRPASSTQGQGKNPDSHSF